MKRIALITIALVLALPLAAQTPSIADIYVNNFRVASTNETRLSILEGSLQEDREIMKPLYIEGMQHIINNSSELIRTTSLQSMAFFLLDIFEESGFTEANYNIWRLFQEYEETRLRLAVLQTLRVTAQGDEAIAEQLTDWLLTQNSLRLGGGNPDLQVVASAVISLGVLADEQAFGVLLQTIFAQYSRTITDLATEALLSLETDFVSQFTRQIELAIPEEKIRILDTVFDLFIDEEIRIEVVFNTLSNALSIRTADVQEQRFLEELRRKTIAYLAQYAKPEYDLTFIDHFDRSYGGYIRGLTTKNILLEAIAALGAVDTDAAATRLTDFLERINLDTENDRTFDRQITLAVIENLRLLGRVQSFNALFVVTILNYPVPVQDAAREALRELSK